MSPATDLQVKVVAVDLSMRDLFAMHAPAPPGWFRPELPARPTLPDTPEDLSARAHSLATAIRYDEASESDIDEAFEAKRITTQEAARILGFLRELQAASMAMVRFDEMAQQERIVQWRWRYADAMLRGREAGRT